MTSASPRSGDSWPIYRRLLTYSLKYWVLIVVAVIGMALDAACTAGFTALLKPLMDDGFLRENWQSVRMLPVWTVLIFAGRGIGTLTSAYAMTAAGRSVVFDMRQALFERMLNLPNAFYDRHAQGQLISKLTFNVEQVANASTDAFTVLMKDCLYVVAFVMVMLYNSVQLTLAVLLVGPLLALLATFVSRRFRKLSHRIQGTVGDVAHRASEVISGQQVVKLFGAQHLEGEGFRQTNANNRRQYLKLVLTRAGSAAIVHIIAGLALGGIIYLAISPDSDNVMTPGSFIAFITAMLALLPSLRRLTTVLETLQKGIAAADSIFETLDEPAENDDGVLPASDLKGRIQFEQVSMAYSDVSIPALHDVSFEAQPGTITAIVGRSGSGKTSLVNLIPRFYRPVSGRVLVDGVDIFDYRLSEYRRQIAVVSQQVVLFNDTVANNIAYGSPDVPDPARIADAARRAGAMDFIEQLAQGMETRIGQDGVQLSGGERQRIAIARAVLLDAPLLILDEATSALDAETERDVYLALDELAHERTTLVIAHRLSTVENADQVIVLDQGRVVECGSHAELMALDGQYALLYRIQFTEDNLPQSGSHVDPS